MANSDRHELEFAPSPHGVLVAYDDEKLDAAVCLKVAIETGSVHAALPGGRLVNCGYVSDAMSDRLRDVDTVVWARLAGEKRETVAVSELELQRI